MVLNGGDHAMGSKVIEAHMNSNVSIRECLRRMTVVRWQRNCGISRSGCVWSQDLPRRSSCSWFIFQLLLSVLSTITWPQMPSRHGPTSQAPSQEGYSSSPSADNHNDPFNNSHSARRYYDNESDNADRRDTYATYASDSSNPALTEQHFYDHNGTYDPYRKSF